jgi:hypothetical protein
MFSIVITGWSLEIAGKYSLTLTLYLLGMITLSCARQEYEPYLVLARDDSPSCSVPVIVDKPGRPVTGYPVVHGVVDVENVVLLMSRL